jgi:hypothetical protein
MLAVIVVLASAPGCYPSTIIGPLSHQRQERDQLHKRALAAGKPVEILDGVFLPLTPEEEQLADDEDASCRSSYMWKNGFTWTGSALVGLAAGLTIGAAYATNTDNTSGKLIFGVSAGTMAALGSVFVAVGGILQQRFTDRGCTSRAR